MAAFAVARHWIPAPSFQRAGAGFAGMTPSLWAVIGDQSPYAAHHTLSASTVSRTSWARTIFAPRAAAANAAAMLPAVRSPASRPVSAPMVDLRDSPTPTG